jgi:type I restriction enzyme S subunit
MARFKLGTAVPRLNIAHVRAIAVPVPPLAEQQRIVAQVNELLTVCDELTTQLSQAQADRQSLLRATIHEALAPRSSSRKGLLPTT